MGVASGAGTFSWEVGNCIGVTWGRWGQWVAHWVCEGGMQLEWLHLFLIDVMAEVIPGQKSNALALAS